MSVDNNKCAFCGQHIGAGEEGYGDEVVEIVTTCSKVYRRNKEILVCLACSEEASDG